MNNLELISTIIATVFGSQVLSTIVQSWFSRRKTNTDADAVISDAAIRFNNQLTERLNKLELDNDNYRKEILGLHDKLTELRVELDLYKAGFRPCPLQKTIDPNAA